MAVVTLSKIIHLIPLWRSRSESNSSLISSFSEYVSVENRVKMALFFSCAFLFVIFNYRNSITLTLCRCSQESEQSPALQQLSDVVGNAGKASLKSL